MGGPTSQPSTHIGMYTVLKIVSAIRRIINPHTFFHQLRLMNFYSYSHVSQVPKLHRGEDVTMAPNTSFRNAQRIWIGNGTHVGEHSIIWAGDSVSRVVIGAKCLIAPHVTLTASNYGTSLSQYIMDQPRHEQDIVLGDDVWLGVNSVVLAGVTIGTGVIVGAGAVVTGDLPDNAIAVGVPARVIGYRSNTDDAATPRRKGR